MPWHGHFVSEVDEGGVVEGVLPLWCMCELMEYGADRVRYSIKRGKMALFNHNANI